LLCPSALKGVLSAIDAAESLARGFRSAGVAAEKLPVADGGEGTCAALLSALGGELRAAAVRDPLGRALEAQFALLSDGRAAVEAAAAVGLAQLGPDELDPLAATSVGLGDLIGAALAESPRSLLIGLGDTATVDGGQGLLEALPSLPVETVVACDVANPLLGEKGAARAFGPQKGASAEQVEELERRLAARADLAPYAALPGAGAAGGLGAALASLGARLVPGASLVVDAVGLPELLHGAALVVTGEGRVDDTSRAGKATGLVAGLCSERGIRCVVFGGRVRTSIRGAETVALSGDPARASADLEALGASLAAGL
jgi:glycerate kinase